LRGKLKIDKPIRLLHGMQDDEVPWKTATRIADCATSDDVRIHLIKNAGHRFSEPQQLALLGQVTATLVADIRASGD
jgi:pimeloyl-ACP methyl ester carboxylesterase